MAYASALLRDPARTYREIDLAGRTAVADGPALVQLLYEELIAALRLCRTVPPCARQQRCNEIGIAALAN